MTMKFRKKPVVIEAIQWTGNNFTDIAEWAEDALWTVGDSVYVVTLEGTMEASKDDWIIKGVKGEFYPCKPDIFEVSYEPVNDTQEQNQ